MSEPRDLPFVDEHRTQVPYPRERVWLALDRYAAGSLHLSPLLAPVLGTEPPAGFERRRVEPPVVLELGGRHRFSTYLLRFELDEEDDDSDASDEPGGTVVRARTYAEFPGLHGRLYRALVIGSHAHAWSVRRMLAAVQHGSRSA